MGFVFILGFNKQRIKRKRQQRTAHFVVVVANDHAGLRKQNWIKVGSLEFY